MTHESLAVIKVGGSLFDWPELPRRLATFIDVHFPETGVERPLLIGGGGPAADVVRELDRIHRIGEQTAHQLALHAMDLSALLLSAIVHGAHPIDSLESVGQVLANGKLPILAPRRAIGVIEQSEEDPLPASWAVTSDSIAARIAAHLKASRLILLKSTSIRCDATRREAAQERLVDPFFHKAARGVERVEYANLRDTTARLQILVPESLGVLDAQARTHQNRQ